MIMAVTVGNAYQWGNQDIIESETLLKMEHTTYLVT